MSKVIDFQLYKSQQFKQHWEQVNKKAYWLNTHELYRNAQKRLNQFYQTPDNVILISGTAAVYNTIDPNTGGILLPGCFTRFIEKITDDNYVIPLMLDNEESNIIGVVKMFSETADKFEVYGHLFLDSIGQKIVANLLKGYHYALSISYQTFVMHQKTIDNELFSSQLAFDQVNLTSLSLSLAPHDIATSIKEIGWNGKKDSCYYLNNKLNLLIVYDLHNKNKMLCPLHGSKAWIDLPTVNLSNIG